MTTPLTLECTIHFERRGAGARRALRTGPEPSPVAPGRIPRVSRLMALALRFDGLLRDGAIENHAELARLGRVTRARITQIMNLLYLAPDIQEDILHLPAIPSGRDRLPLRRLQPIAAVLSWTSQRRMWRELKEKVERCVSNSKNPICGEIAESGAM